MGKRALMVCGLVLALCAGWGVLAMADEGAPAGEMSGLCYYYDDATFEAFVSLGSNHGLRPGARVAFVRKGEVVAEGEVTRVRVIDCVVKPDADTPGGAIQRGDVAKVVSNGTREALEAQQAQERQLHWLKTAFFSGLLLYTIML